MIKSRITFTKANPADLLKVLVAAYGNSLRAIVPIVYAIDAGGQGTKKVILDH